MSIQLFGGFSIHGGSPELQNALQARIRFVEAYAKEKGWTEPLTMQQVLEVRAQKGWKHPEGT